MLKKVLVVFTGIIVLLLVLPLILPAKMHIERSIEFRSAPVAVHTYLADLNNYPRWNPFSENDPGSSSQVSGAGVGSFLIWKGEKTGEGKMTITRIQAPQNIHIKLEFYTPIAGEATVVWTTEAVEANKTRMIWSMDEDLSYFHRYFGLFMKDMIGKTFESGLGNLKKLIGKS